MRLAKRVGRLAASPTMAVSEEANRLRLEGRKVVDFSIGEPDFNTPDNIKVEGHRAIEENFTRYTAAPGIKDLRKAVVEKYRRQYGVEYSVPEVVISCGAKHTLFNVAFVLFEEGDEVLLPVPYWVTFPEQLKMVGAVPVEVVTREEDNFVLKASALEEKVTSHTRAIVVNTPNNPTGAVIPAEEMDQIVDLALDRNLMIIFDECYDYFVFDGNKHTSLAQYNELARQNSLLVNTASKTYAMTGWRIGYLVAPQEIAKSVSNVQSHSANPSSVSQKAALESILGDQNSVSRMIAEYERRRHYVVERLNDMPGLSCANPGGAFYAFPNISSYIGGQVGNSVEFSTWLLRESGVAVVPGSAFGMDGHIRISFATSMENLILGMDLMEDVLAKI